MKRIGYSFVLLAALAAFVGTANATPTANAAAINARVFNDCPFSTLTVTNGYPALLNINDAVAANTCGGWANLHDWSFSSDGGTSAAVFDNNACFSFGCDLVITGTNQVEAGLRVSPWWSQWVDGRLNVRIPDGEIAAFGGRLPFVTWTNPADPSNVWGSSLHYVAGDPIHLEIHYNPHSLTQLDPGTIQYIVVYGGNTYMTAEIPFDEGNVTEGLVYGNWGILNDARVGGYMQFANGSSPIDIDKFGNAQFTNIQYSTCSKPTPTRSTTWGQLKTLYR